MASTSIEMATEEADGSEPPAEAMAEKMTVTEASGSTTDETIRQAMDRVDLSSNQATQASESPSFEPVPFFVLESKPVVPLEPLILSDEDPAEENVELMLMAGLRALPESAFHFLEECSSTAAASTAAQPRHVANAFADAWFHCTVQRLANASLHLSVADTAVTENDGDDEGDIQRFSTPYGEHIYTYVHETNALYQGKFIIEQPVVEVRGLRSTRRVIFFAWKQRLHLTSTTAAANASRKRRRSSDSPVTVVDDEAGEDAVADPLPSVDDGSSPPGHSKRPKLSHDNGDDAAAAAADAL
eukprot:gene8067-5810_t